MLQGRERSWARSGIKMVDGGGRRTTKVDRNRKQERVRRCEIGWIRLDERSRLVAKLGLVAIAGSGTGGKTRP